MNRRTQLTALVLGLLAITVATVLALRHRAAPSMPSDLRILDTHFMGLLPLYVADEQGYFREAGINVQWLDVRDPAQASRMFFAKDGDLMMTTFANILPAEVQEPGSVRLLCPAFESSTEPGSFILVKPDSTVMNLEDLRGKTIGTYSGPSQRAYVLVVLRHLGLKEPEDVRLVQVAPSAQVQGLFGGTFDAIFTVEPYASTAITNGARVLDAGVRPKYIADPFWIGAAAIRPDLVTANPGLPAALLTSLTRACDYIRAHEADARALLSKRTDLAADVAARCALYSWVPAPSSEAFVQMQAHADLLNAEGLLERTVDVKSLFTQP